MAKTNKLLLIGGLGVAAYILYQKYGNPMTGGTLQPSPAQPITAGGNINPTTIAQVSAAASIPGQYGSNTPVNPNATLDQQTLIFNWARNAWGGAQPGDLAQLLKMFPNFTAADIAGLVDLITSNFAPSAAHTSFWNNWRAQYDIDNGTYS